MFVRKASANWQGSITEGKGSVKLPAAGVETPFSFQSRFGDEKNTNPEELIAAAHAGCYSMALSGNLGRAGYTAETIDTEAQVRIEKVEGGFEIPSIHLVSRVKVDGITDDEFQQIAEKTKETCPISKVLRAADITLEATRV